MRSLRLLTAVALLTASAAPLAAQAEPEKPKTPAAAPAAPGFEGKWEGSLETPNGNQGMYCSLKKGDSGWTGTITGMQGDVPLSDLKMNGDTLTGSSVVQTPNGNFTVWYWFTVKENTMNVSAEVNANGQSFPFNFVMTRAKQE
jgi:hypothetical protein